MRLEPFARGLEAGKAPSRLRPREGTLNPSVSPRRHALSGLMEAGCKESGLSMLEPAGMLRAQALQAEGNSETEQGRFACNAAEDCEGVHAVGACWVGCHENVKCSRCLCVCSGFACVIGSIVPACIVHDAESCHPN